ncbi:cadherin-like domain-containing protein [Leptolyngbya iicbica]|uniref:Tandem-95 repeat protein n=2 Tax=Cyanophyceae TaxID=3028117 RepID=A0A4Q7E4D6_9CYAN|nr:cadherin-like domain-containing protein [Leptolyngbya sp. LK]RZM77700.1 tandem-95 repeat protein [Leptolyngbya sp. LK]
MAIPIIQNNILSIEEGNTRTLSLNNLNATAGDAALDEILITVEPTSEGSLAGTFLLDGLPTLSFTLDDVDMGLVEFEHDGSNFAPSYNIIASNDGDVSAPDLAQVLFDAVNDSPDVEANALTIAEGGTVVFNLGDTVNLLVTDEEGESTAAELTYDIQSVTNGKFQKLEDGVFVDLGVGDDAFTQADVDNELIRFVHDGSELAPTYRLRVVDSGLPGEGFDKLPIGQSIRGNITFEPVNDAPTLTTNTLTLSEGDTVTITAANLAATDVEEDDATLTFTITAIAGGRFELLDAPGGSVVDVLAAPGQAPVGFTQQQVSDGLVQFVNDPATDTAPSYSVQVSDSGRVSATAAPNPDLVQTDSGAISQGDGITFAPVNDVPIVKFPNVDSALIDLAEQTQVTLSNNDLSVEDEESTAANLVYTVTDLTESPNEAAGEFLLEDVDTGESSPTLTFTQADIDAGLVSFNYFGDKQAPSFELTVTDEGGESVVIAGGEIFNFLPNNDVPQIADDLSPLALPEGEMVLITAANLSVTDEESTAAELTYTVTINNLDPDQPDSFIIDGVVELGPEVTFTQKQIDDGLVILVHGGSNFEPDLTISVTDTAVGGDANTIPVSLNIAFEPLNDLPVLEPLALSLTEGGTVPITDAVLSVSDEESGAADITYTVDAVTGGQFLRLSTEPGGEPTVATTFTQADIDAGDVIVFEHDGSNDAPTFSLAVSDGEDAIAITDADGQINFTATNDAPVLTNNTLTVPEGNPDNLVGITLTADNLLTEDEESAPEGLTYTVTIADNDAENPDFFQVDGVREIGPEVTFTQAQVNDGLVQFVHGGSNSIATLTVSVTDTFPEGEPITTPPVPLNVDFQAENDLPVVVNNRLAINESGLVIFGPNNLKVTDEETTAAADLVYTIEAVTNGDFELRDLDLGTATKLTVGQTFTQADIDGGLIQFKHDGEEAAPTYELSLVDTPLEPGGPVNEVAIASKITFENINDDPTLTANAIEIDEGGSVILTPDNLAASDPDNLASELRFNITNVQGGTFTFDGQPLVEGANFTSQDLLLKELKFTDNGDETKPAYTVTVLDPEGGVTTGDAAVTFNPVNDPPEITVNTFTIAEGGILTLNDKDTPGVVNLAATDDETAAAALVFTLSNVQGGSFVDFNAQPITEFTQSVLNQGEITFVQDGSSPVPSFDITVKDAAGETVTVAANVDFIPVNDAPEVQVSTFAVTEGETVTLSSETLLTLDDEGESGPEDLTYKITIADNDAEQPDGFEVDGVLQTGPEVTFTQAQVNDGLVKFVHGGSNTIADISATVTDAFPAEFGEPITIPVTLEIGFTATNDPLVVEKNSLTINEGQTVTLTENNLRTTDEETAPEDILYTVVATTNGSFQRRNLDPDDTATTIPVDGTFSQAEITAGLIQFKQDGAEAAPTFSLKVEDTPLAPGDETNSITFDGVIAAFENVNDAPTLTANALTVTEGGEVTVTPANLAATDPDNSQSQLRFSIGAVTGGEFFLDGALLAPEQKFTAAAIAFGELTFKDDGDEIAPTYTVTVTDQQVDGTTVAPAAVTFNKVNDDPDITINTFTITEGKRLTLNNPDTPEVINLAATDPETLAPNLLFRVSNVVGGQFFDFAAQPITEFTQALLNAGEVSFKHNGSETSPTFDITVVDADGGTFTEAGNVVSFVPINDPPVIGKAQLTVTEGATITLTGDNIAVDDPDTPSENLIITVSGLSGGSFNLVVDGVVTENVTSFTEAQVIAGQVQFVDDGDQVQPSFSVSASDGEFTSVAVPITIVEFLNINDAPTAVPDPRPGNGAAFTTDEDTAFVTGDVLANDTDVDPGDQDNLFISAIAGQAVATGDITLASGAIVSLADGGTINYNPNGAFQLALGETDTDSFSYTVSDPNGGSNTTTVTVTITGVNDAPIAKDDPIPEDEDDLALFTAPDNAPFTTRPLTDNDEDEDGDTLKVTKLNNLAAVVGIPVTLDDTDTTTATLNADGSITYTPPEIFRMLAVGETATDSFTYTIADPSGVESTATVTMLINGVNEAPTITSELVTFDTTEGNAIDLNLLTKAGITDIDLNDNPNLTISSVSDASFGTITNNGSTLTYTPGQSLIGGQVATETLTYTVSDGNGGEVDGTVNINITGINDLPIALNDSGAGFRTDEATAFTTANVLGNDFDPEFKADPSLGQLEIINVDTSNTRGLIVNRGNGTFSYDPNGAFNLLPVGRSATDQFTYTVQDEQGATATATVSITIRGLLSTFIDYEQQLQLDNPAAVAPGEFIDSLPLAQLFDESFYLSQNPDVASLVGSRFTSGYQHFVQFGINEGRNPSVLFNESFYLARHGDVRNAVATGALSSGLSHFLTRGHREGRDPSAFFDQSDYLLNNPDVSLAVAQGRLTSAFQHYILTGVDEGRVPSLALFNEQFYLRNSPDVAAAGTDPYEHFIDFGQFEGRRPSALYNEDSYLALNPDVAAAVNATPGFTGFQHYQEIGRFEGRRVFA